VRSGTVYGISGRLNSANGGREMGLGGANTLFVPLKGKSLVGNMFMVRYPLLIGTVCCVGFHHEEREGHEEV